MKPNCNPFYSPIDNTLKNGFQLLYTSDSEDEEEVIATISSKKEELLRLGRAFWEEQQRGKTMKWGDWCDEEEE